MAVAAVADFLKSALGETALHARQQIYPEGQLCAVEGRLLDDGPCRIAGLALADKFYLIGGIAHEIALESRHAAFQLFAEQLAVGILHGLQL